MDELTLKRLLRAVERGDLSSGEAAQALRSMTFAEMGYAKVDAHRRQRCGVPEAIFCQGKTVAQVKSIAQRMLAHDANLLATRASKEVAAAIRRIAPRAEFNELARTVVVRPRRAQAPAGEILIVCAGTSDLPAAEEARVTAEFLDNRVRSIYDVGVAGLHRLMHHERVLRKANVIIVVAGMEGALASVVGGMVACPVIGVPTSVGYGANFQGLAPLLTMLNSCAAGVAVVNIDNGFGAACVASLINHIGRRHGQSAK